VTLIALVLTIILVLATIAIAWFLPREDEMERIATSQREVPAPVTP